MKNNEAITIGLGWNIITKCGNYLIVYIREPGFNVPCERASDEVSNIIGTDER